MDSLTFINLEYFFLKIYECITGACNADTGIISDFLEKIKPFSILLSLLLIAGIIYSIIRIWQIRKEEAEELSRVIVPKGHEEKKLEKWNQLIELSMSENHADWRLAIIEADVMLDDMLDLVGYHGEGIGEKLKQINRDNFQTLDKAWEAHKVRNQIAHAGSDFKLSQREVKRVIDLYKQVLEEFNYI